MSAGGEENRGRGKRSRREIEQIVSRLPREGVSTRRPSWPKRAKTSVSCASAVSYGKFFASITVVLRARPSPLPASDNASSDTPSCKIRRRRRKKKKNRT